MEKNINQIYAYFLRIFEYEKYLAKIYDKSSLSKNKEEFQGSLIKLSDYDKFKQTLQYDKLLEATKYSTEDSFKKEFKRLAGKFDLSISEIKKMEQVKINTPEELIKLIQNGSKYKIINSKICDSICTKEKYFSYNYTYYINNNNLVFFDISFSHNNNVLDEISYIKGSEKLRILSNSIITYFNLEKVFIDVKPFQVNNSNNSIFYDEFKKNRDNNNNLSLSLDKEKIQMMKNKRNFSYDRHGKTKSQKQYNITAIKISDSEMDKANEGFLIDEKWVNEWKKNTNYNQIIEGYSNDIRAKYEEIAEKIYFYQKNSNENIELNPMELIFFNSKSEYQNYIKHNNIVVVNYDFVKLFIQKDIDDINNYGIKYSLTDKKITIYFNEMQMDFISAKNIILKKTIGDLLILKYIKKFHGELISYNNYQNNFVKIGIIERNWIKKLKLKYLYYQYPDEIKKINIQNINLSNLSKQYQDKTKK